MNSKIPLILFMGLVFTGTQAYAQCENASRLNRPAVIAALSGKTISFECVDNCEPWMTSTSPDWHELHQGDGGGTLTEIGTGAEGLQPTKDVGSWTVQGFNVEYSYTGDGGSPYSYSVHLISGNAGDPNSSYEFCLNGSTHKATGTIDP